MKEEEIRNLLFEKQDTVYRDFQAKLMPNVDKQRIIGVRTPILRAMAKELIKDSDIDEFLISLPHPYYDEYNLHGFIISECKDFARSVAYVEAFLPYVDNWATCDLLSPKSFKKHRDELKKYVTDWMQSEEPFTVRFGIEMAMSHYLDEDFCTKFLEETAKVKKEDYYVKMMVAWYFATALAKQWETTIPIIEQKILSPWVQNKTVQKAIESYRITDEQKAYLRTLKL